MKIGVPREVKANEARVAMLPGGVQTLVAAGHAVAVEEGAGAASGYGDELYRSAGAKLVRSASELYSNSELIVKVKEPQLGELPLLLRGQIIFGYFHFAASEPLTRACLKAGISAVAFESLEDERGGLPLLLPMSAIAGRLSVQMGAHFLERPQGGSGVLLGGVPGVHPGRVVILGGGVVGEQAARMAAGLGADVQLFELSQKRQYELASLLPPNVRVLQSSPDLMAEQIAQADLLVGAVLVRGRRAPHLVTRALLKTMRPGSVFVDVCIDQGGTSETSRPTTHASPTYVEEGVLHYCVPNMPGAVPRTSTQALAGAILPYVRQLAQHGLDDFLALSPGHRLALNLRDGVIENPDVAATFPGLKG